MSNYSVSEQASVLQTGTVPVELAIYAPSFRKATRTRSSNNFHKDPTYLSNLLTAITSFVHISAIGESPSRRPRFTAVIASLPW